MEKYTKEELIEIITKYDTYIYENQDRMCSWCPVGIMEFINNELECVDE